MENENINEEIVVEDDTKKLVGLGGWMIFMIIRFSISLLTYSRTIFNTIKLHMNGEMDILQDNGMSEYIPNLTFIINVELISNICMLVFTIIVLCLIFNKKRIAPRLVIIQVIVVQVIIILDLIAVNSIIAGTFNSQAPRLFGNFIGSILIIAYFLESKRVKNTFVN